MSSKVSISERLTSIRDFFTSGKVFQTSIRVTAVRWLDRTLLGMAAALSFYLLFPFILAALPFSGSISIWILLPAAALAGWAIQAIQRTYSIRFRRKELQPDNPINISATLKYPTLHFSLFIAVGILLSVAFQADELYFNQASGLLLITLLFSYTIAVILNSPTSADEDSGSSRTMDLDNCSNEEFKEWITDESPSAGFDFYNRQPYITRMATRVLEKTESSGQRGQVLYGEFGTGKTTLIKLVEQEILRQEPDCWIVSNFDCWAHGENSQKLIKLLLEQVVSDISKRVEAVSLHSVPDDYLEVAYGVSSWIKLITPFLPKHNPHTVLKRIDTLLEAQDLKLLLVIENIDRSPAVVALVNSVAAVLDQVSQFESIRFIFSGSKEKLPLPTVARIADYTETLSTKLSPLVIGQFLKLCLDYSLDAKRNEKPVIPWLEKDFIPASTSNVLRHFKLEKGEVIPKYHIEGTNERLLDALVNCLANPRQLKLVFRYVFERWKNLEGEINLIDLLLYGTAIHDGEILEISEKYNINPPKSGSPENPFFIAKKEKDPFKRAQNERDNEKQKWVTYPGSRYQQRIAYYLAYGEYDFGEFKVNPIQRIKDTNADNQNKYTMVANTGSVLGYPSDQRLISYLNEISRGNKTAFAKLMSDFTLDLEAGYVDELLEGLKENHWQSSQPLLPIISAAIEYKEVVDSLKHKEFFNKIIDALINQRAVLPKSPLRPDEIAAFEKNHADEVHNAIARSLNSLYQDGRYYQLLLMLDRISTSCRNDREVIIEPLIRTYYTKEVAKQWAQAYQTTGVKYDSALKYFEFGLKTIEESSSSHQPEDDLATLVCEALLYVTHFITSDKGRYLEQSFDLYKNNKDLKHELLTRANKTEVKSGLSSTALQALKTLHAVYKEETLENR